MILCADLDARFVAWSGTQLIARRTAMIIISDVLVPSKEMMQAVIRGMCNPYNSWDKSDNGGT